MNGIPFIKHQTFSGVILPPMGDVCSAAAAKPRRPPCVPDCSLCLGSVHFFLPPSLGESLAPCGAQTVIQNIYIHTPSFESKR